MAVDIDTSDERYQEIPAEVSNHHKVVWGRPAYLEGEGLHTWVRPLPVMGQRRDQEPAYWGIAMLPSDRDWIVRSYSNCVDVENAAPQQSFVLAILQAREGKPNQCESGDVQVSLLQGNYDFHNISLSKLANSKESFQGRIVLLGGTYSYHDRHPTPYGLKNGVDLLAMAAESELESRDRHPASWWGRQGLNLVFKLGLTLLIVAVHTFLRPAAALLATMLFLSFLPVIGFMTAYYLLGFDPEFVPFLIGIWIEQLIESSNRSQTLAKEKLVLATENAELATRNSELQTQLRNLPGDRQSGKRPTR